VRYVNPPGACGARGSRGLSQGLSLRVLSPRACVSGPRRGCGPRPTRPGTLVPGPGRGAGRARARDRGRAGTRTADAARGSSARHVTRLQRPRRRRARKTCVFRAHGPRTCHGAEPPRAASWCARRAPWHIALALCEGRDSAPEACGVPPAAHARPGNESAGDGNRPLPASGHAHGRVDAARVTGRGTWGHARRARCRAPGANAPHAGARRARGRMVRRVRREESRSGRRSREPVARRAACARARRPSTGTPARRWSRESNRKRRDVAGHQRGKCDPSRGMTRQRIKVPAKRKPSRLVTKVDQSRRAPFRLTACRGNLAPSLFPGVH
jgi:hypothetical protein